MKELLIVVFLFESLNHTLISTTQISSVAVKLRSESKNFNLEHFDRCTLNNVAIANNKPKIKTLYKKYKSEQKIFEAFVSESTFDENTASYLIIKKVIKIF